MQAQCHIRVGQTGEGELVKGIFQQRFLELFDAEFQILFIAFVPKK
jgi:hypothetical protein